MPLPPADLPCPVDPPALVADRGAALHPAGGCAAILIETAPTAALFSWGGARVDGDVAPSFTLDLWWRRLGERGGAPLEIAFPGGTLMLRDGAVGWWENDARWAERAWIALDTRTSEAHAVTLRQDGAVLRAWLDGVELPGHVLATVPAPGRLSIGLKGGPGDRARMWLDRVALRPAGAP